jgi:biopolymer transport protein ExbB/TolQ
MTISVDVWELVGLAVSLLTAFVMVMFSAGKLLIGQFDRRLNERFTAQDAARKESQKHWDTKFAALENAAAAEAKEWSRIEKEILLLKAELPDRYVRRDDYIRNQSIIESKIDGLAMRIENAILKGERHG